MNRLSAAIMIASMPIVGIVAVSAGPIWVEPCSKVTCERAKTSKLVPEGPIVISGIVSVAPSAACPAKCADIDTATSHIHAIGTPQDIFCKIWGGPVCIWKEDK